MMTFNDLKQMNLRVDFDILNLTLHLICDDRVVSTAHVSNDTRINDLRDYWNTFYVNDATIDVNVIIDGDEQIASLYLIKDNEDTDYSNFISVPLNIVKQCHFSKKQ